MLIIFIFQSNCVFFIKSLLSKMGWWYWFLALLILFVVFYHFIRNNGPSRVGQYYSRRFSSSSAYPTTTLYNHKMPDTMTQKKIRTIAVLPATMNVPLIPFTCELYHALSVTTRVLRLSSKSVVEQLGDEDIVERKEDERLMNWLTSQEDTHDLVIYQCDYPTNNWTRRCLSQADAILVVAHGDQKPPGIPFIDEYLKLNEEGINCSRKELVLLWPDYNANPIGTYEWLNGNWFSGHYHIHSQERMFNWEKNGDNKNEKEILAFYENKVFPYVIDIHSDFARLGRILSGNAVGLVLGGGGARGGAHIGVIKALREQGIPIDMVGGTSIGAMVGGVLAMNPYNMDHLVEKSRYWFEGMCSNWKTFLDLTWGFSARFTGFNFNELLKGVFIEKTIEDLWLPYFCITTDITNSVMRVHRNGHLWRYVRASMSLAVYLPPICDPEDGHYLLDGGYMNNLPADVMRNFGARTVIAIDVSLADEKEFHNYGDYLNGFYAQLQALLPWNKGVSRILNAQEIQDRLAFISSVRQLELVKKAPYCNYCRPPIDEFLTLDFAKFDIIREVGYNYGKANVPELMRINNHLAKLIRRELLTLTNSSSNESSLRNSSFTDMAATQSSRTPPKKPSCHSLDDLSKCSSSPTSSSSSSSSKQEIGQDSDSDFVIEEKVVSIPAGEEIIMIEATFKAKISRQTPNNDDDDD